YRWTAGVMTAPWSVDPCARLLVNPRGDGRQRLTIGAGARDPDLPLVDRIADLDALAGPGSRSVTVAVEGEHWTPLCVCDEPAAVDAARALYVASSDGSYFE